VWLLIDMVSPFVARFHKYLTFVENYHDKANFGNNSKTALWHLTPADFGTNCLRGC